MHYRNSGVPVTNKIDSKYTSKTPTISIGLSEHCDVVGDLDMQCRFLSAVENGSNSIKFQSHDRARLTSS